MSQAIENRYEFVYLFDVENGNPNGDPDAGNMPRVDPETNYGIVTDVCLKRKIRNFVEIVKNRQKPFDIYVQEKAILTDKQGEAYDVEDIKNAEGGDKIAKARDWMCRNFFDIRTFGAVMSLKENNCGQVRGPVQMNFARSVEPVVPLDVTITRMAVATAKEAKSQEGDNRTMGRKSIVPYGLYKAEGYISAYLARQTHFSEDDLELLWQALINMFDHDHSAARGKMAARSLVVFKHDNMLGNAPAHMLLDRLEVARAHSDNKPARAFSDYKVTLDETDMPKGVTVEKKLWS
ncbi:MAG TPA: type I-C CRISPR-associated protein Cas7/Csd2 [Sedimentisphaerales bacterium]|nr:type I-C CRISPR-associated protein Cas7/Csd2 [Sedimentisphaerales bacterium]HRS10774.1 type I-C CRISPR-associated protein Cas7/Csd2 [Sedimentisphaerales bacterium]HRV47479.1 type I-C CRISPR-associated protein Cas7/Csd2 [Sedimentisphaerales bacterium]